MLPVRLVIGAPPLDGGEGESFLSAYCVSTAGLNSLTRCLASEWGAFNITVNAIAPGMIQTDMIKPFEADPAIINHSISLIPLGRLGEPREVALRGFELDLGAGLHDRRRGEGQGNRDLMTRRRRVGNSRSR